MEDLQNKSRMKKVLRWLILSPVNTLFILLILFYVVRIFVLGQDVITVKAQAIGILFLWILWIFAKSLIKLLLFLALVLAAVYGWYQYTRHDQILCNENGGRWNHELNICEEKLTFWQQLKRAVK